MVHVVRRLLGAFLVLAIVAGATLALSSRPRLETDRNAVERDWRGVRSGLGARYALVDQLARAINAVGGPTNPIISEVSTAYASWTTLTADSDVGRSIATANTLEGLARRLALTVSSSPLLKVNKAVTSALQRVNQSGNPGGVTALQDAVARYEKDRGGPVRRLVAGPLGYSAIPRLALAAGD